MGTAPGVAAIVKVVVPQWNLVHFLIGEKREIGTRKMNEMSRRDGFDKTIGNNIIHSFHFMWTWVLYKMHWLGAAAVVVYRCRNNIVIIIQFLMRISFPTLPESFLFFSVFFYHFFLHIWNRERNKREWRGVSHYLSGIPPEAIIKLKWKHAQRKEENEWVENKENFVLRSMFLRHKIVR